MKPIKVRKAPLLALVSVILITLICHFFVKEVPADAEPKFENLIKTDFVKTRKLSGGRRNRTIFYLGWLGEGMGTILQFDGCEYTNCVYSTSYNTSYIPHADAVIFPHTSEHITITVPPHIRQKQLWFVYAVESPAYEFNIWNKAINDFNGTMTYLLNSIPSRFSYGFTYKKPVSTSEVIDYAKGKTKVAYAYVSNCNSKLYDRLKIMKELQKYIDLDIYGSCTGNIPCSRQDDADCETKLHSQYRFYLAFENSLCEDYITEKFYKTLHSPNHLVPVALGGLSTVDYDAIAPPNSFVHVYNFTSLESLGLYLKSLMKDDAAYNRYHEWRNHYTISMMASQKITCDFCKVLNFPELLESTRNKKFADEFNDPKKCRTYS